MPLNDNGYVYALMNPSMKGLVKIGKTTRQPKDRAEELSSVTGVPTPFVVVYECFFEDCSKAEEYVHVYLESNGYRISKSREFFEIAINVAIDAILIAKNHFGEFIPHSEILNKDTYESNDLTPSEEMYEKGINAYYGIDDELIDYEDAMEFFLKAQKLGSIKACHQIGLMYEMGEGVTQNDIQAISYYKQAVKDGHLESLDFMARIFARRNNIENAIKCYEKYLLSGLFNARVGYAYLEIAINNHIAIKCVDIVTSHKNELINYCEEKIEYLSSSEMLKNFEGKLNLYLKVALPQMTQEVEKIQSYIEGL
jgi:tetratricopeptide (TPR) repeat protein